MPVRQADRMPYTLLQGVGQRRGGRRHAARLRGKVKIKGNRNGRHGGRPSLAEEAERRRKPEA
jgi:hypothetical protein